jgi:5-carboxymethyl-2-hydroxymuconate isomerase
MQKTGEKIQTGKIVCVGRNYVEHAHELGNEVPEFPLIFMKPASAVIHSGDSITHPKFADELHYEMELVLLIGKTIKNAGAAEAEEAIAAYGAGLDMTLRDLQSQLKKKGHPWTLAKCFDGSAVLSDFISKDDYQLTLDEKIMLNVNGELRQNAPLNTMIFKPVDILIYLSERMTLEAGDLIFSGTPKGVGRVLPGDTLSGGIEGIAELYTKIV